MNQNRTDIIGNLGATPELRFTKSGTAVCDLRIATNERFTDSQGNKQTKTDWHRVVVWGKQAENCCEHLAKGRLVRVSGKLRNNYWDDKNGVRHYTSEIHAREVDFGPNKSEQSSENFNYEGEQQDNAPEQALDHREVQF